MTKKIDVQSPNYKPVIRHTQNFLTLKGAFVEDDVALLEVEVTEDVLFKKGDRVAAVVTVGKDGEDFAFTPFCLFMNGNPFELLKMVEPG